MNLLRKGLELTIILLFAAFLFAGCGRKEAEKKYMIGISQCSYDDWRKKMNEEIEREVMMHPDVEVEIRSADDRSEKQIEDIHYFVENDFDILVVAPNEADSITPIIKEVYDSGIPVLLFDRSIHGASFTSWQGADNMEIGRAAARYASKLEHQNPGSG